MKKFLIPALIVILLLLLVPFPKHVETSYFALDSFSGEKATITLDMTYYRFLVLKDKMTGTISVTTPQGTTVYGEHLNYSGLWPSNNEDKTMHALNGVYFNETSYMHDYGDGVLGSRLVGFEPVRVFLSPDFTKILLSHQGNERPESTKTKEYIGHQEEGKTDVAATYFIGFTENKPQ